MKLLALGIDDADARILKKMDMPFMQQLMTQNTEILLEEDILSRGWAEFYTGKHARDTGAFYDYPLLGKSYNKSQKFGTSMLPHNTVPLWDLLSQRGYRVGVMNVPTTMPAQNVNGFMVAGGGGGLNKLKQVQQGLCYPESVMEGLKSRSYIVDIRLTTSGISELPDFFRQFTQMVHKRTENFIDLCKKHKTDFSFIAYRALANIQFLGMSEMEYLFQSQYQPEGNPNDPNSIYFRGQLQKFYSFFDECIKNIFQELEPKNFILFSDHGKVPYLYNLNYNEFVKSIGLQKANPFYSVAAKRFPAKIKRWLRSVPGRKATALYLPFSMEQTKVFALDLINGIYINDYERFGGPVSSAGQAKDLIRIICREFNGCDEAKKHGMSALPYRERFLNAKFADFLPDVWVEKPDTMRPFGPGRQFVEKNPHYRHITNLTDVYDDNWTGIKGRHPLFVVSKAAADDNGDIRGNLTAGYDLINRMFQ